MPQTETREAQIHAQMGRLAGVLEDLNVTVGQLEDRLRDVLRDEPEDRDVSEPQQGLVPLADRIRECALNVEGESERLKSILSRIEL